MFVIFSHFLSRKDAMAFCSSWKSPRPEGTLGCQGSRGEFADNLNPHSLELIPNAWAEPCISQSAPGDRFQFERLGYFARDPDCGEGGWSVFNKTIGLRDTWAKIVKGGEVDSFE
jgi:hypothetical protein